MPTVNFGYFPPVKKLFRWDGSSDSELTDWLSDYWTGIEAIYSFAYRDFEVDRSGPGVSLTTRPYTLSGGTWYPYPFVVTVPLTEGDIVSTSSPDPTNYDPPAVVSVDGMWESDEFGRAIELQDLASPDC